MWPASIVQQLRKQLPPGYVAEPRVHLGTLMEIDVGALEADEAPQIGHAPGNGGVATAVWTAPAVAEDFARERDAQRLDGRKRAIGVRCGHGRFPFVGFFSQILVLALVENNNA